MYTLRKGRRHDTRTTPYTRHNILVERLLELTVLATSEPDTVCRKEWPRLHGVDGGLLGLHAFTPLRHCNTRQSSVDSWRGVLLRRIFIRHRVGPTRTRAPLQHPSIIRGLMARCADPQVNPTRLCASLQHLSIIRRRVVRRADPQGELIRGATYSNRSLLTIRRRSFHPLDARKRAHGGCTLDATGVGVATTTHVAQD